MAYALAFIAAAVAALVAAEVSSSWAAPTIVFIVVVGIGAVATGLAESGALDRDRAEANASAVTAAGPGSVAIGGSNNGCVSAQSTADSREKT
jgi:hypothetical protein